MKVSGEFEVNLAPLDVYAKGKEGVSIGRMSIDKSYSGLLSGTSKGEMINALTTFEGSASYVAIEQFVGELEGKRGSFVLQHYGVMHEGHQRLILEVVPNSASGELIGLGGKMAIRIEHGHHYYDFEYEKSS